MTETLKVESVMTEAQGIVATAITPLTDKELKKRISQKLKRDVTTGELRSAIIRLLDGGRITITSDRKISAGPPDSNS